MLNFQYATPQPLEHYTGGADNSPLGSSASSAIGSAVIGSGLGLGSERDKKRHVSPAHDLVLLSLKTLSYLSVPSGRLILLIKVSICNCMLVHIKCPARKYFYTLGLHFNCMVYVGYTNTLLLPF